jgi:hypothetical protein
MAEPINSSMADSDPSHYLNRHAGEDIYVLGSGPTLQHTPARFFNNKITVSANAGPLKVLPSVTYMVTKYHEEAWRIHAERPDITVVTTRHNTGNHNSKRLENAPFTIVDHPHNTCAKWHPDQWPPEGQFLATWSTITTAIHWAAHLGAANIILCGHDCGWIDGMGRIPMYRVHEGKEAHDTDSVWWYAWTIQTQQVKTELQERYGCTITSVNPWINLNLEGHAWIGVTA